MKPRQSEFKLPALALAGAVILTLPVSDAGAASLDAKDIEAQVLQHVREQIPPVAGQEIDIKVIGVVGAPFSFADAATKEEILTEVTSTLSAGLSDQAMVRLRMHDPSGRSQEIGVPVRLTIKKPVWVVKNFVQSGQALSPADFKLVMQDVSRNVSHVVGQERDITQYSARINLQPDSVLDSRNIVIPPEIKRNTAISIVLTNGKNLHIVIEGKALEDGYKGETVRVRHAWKPQKTYTAKVIDTNKVLIEL